MEEIEFVDYESSQYNHCDGVLTVKINNKLVSFGEEFAIKSKYNADEKYRNVFWRMNCSFDGEWRFCNSHWEFDKEECPQNYLPYFEELIHLLKENVVCGCTGCS